MSNQLIADATFSRASAARYVDSALVIKSAAIDAARDSHYINKGLKTLLLEDERTNLLLRSEEFDNGSWTKTRTTVSANSTTAPDDEVTADSIIEDSSASATHFVEQNVTITAGAFIAFTYYLKLSTRTFAKLICEDSGAANGFEAYFNLTTGAVGTSGVVGAGTTFTAARITPAANGFFRCEIVGKLAAGITSCDCRLHLADADNSDSYNGDGAKLIFAFGAQLEDQAEFASSYIPTVGSTVTRSADKISWPFTLTPQAMTIYVRLIESGDIDLTFGKVVSIGKSDASDPRVWVEASSGFYRIKFQTAAGNVTSTLAAAPSIGQVVELRGVLFPDGAVQIHQSINGAAEVSATKSGTLALPSAWSDQVIWLNSVGALTIGFTPFDAIKVERGVQTRAYLRAL